MVDGILKLNLPGNGLEESTRSLSRYYDGKGDAPKLNKNLFLNLNVPIPALNYIIDESKNYVAGNAHYQRCSEETFRHAKNLLDIIMRISLQRRARTNQGQREMLFLPPQGLHTGEEAHPTEGNKQTEQPKREELTGQAAKNGLVTPNGEGVFPNRETQQRVDTSHDGDPTIAHGKNIAGKGEVEGLKYYPGFCMQLGAKGRRCMLELIRRVYREKTSTCKNILTHKLKPPACISNLPFFNIHMLWKLSYEFGVFEEALKIHRIYGQSGGTFNEILNGGCSMPNCSNCEGETDKVGTRVKRELSEEQSGTNGPHNGNSSNGGRVPAGRKRKRQECTQNGGKYNWSRERLQSCDGVPPKEGPKKVVHLCSGRDIPDGRRLPMDTAKWINWNGSEMQTSQCIYPQVGYASPAEGADAQGSAPPKDTTEGPTNWLPLPSRGITSGEGKKENMTTGNDHMEDALPNLLFNENCESCRMNRAYGKRSLQKGRFDEKKETSKSEEEEEEVSSATEEGEPIQTFDIRNDLKVDSVEELLSNFVHISNAILLHLKKNKGTCLPRGKYSLLSDHCLLLIPINQQRRRKTARSNAHKGNEPNSHEGNVPNAHEGNRPNAHEGNRPNAHEGNVPNAQRRVHHQYDHRGVEQMKTDRVLHEVGNVTTSNNSIKDSLPQGQRKTAKWRRQQCCSPARGKRKKLSNGMTSGMISGIAPVVIAKNKPLESTRGDYIKLPPSAEIQKHITPLLADNWGSCTNRASDTGKTTRKRKNPSDARRGRSPNDTTTRLTTPYNES
ncbi:Uncharacterized protein PCOAH_00043260 [Plasmodium coatneyi]|uniref:Uncharacterized protein n=1 Tax=Plasmodium coatneyi TaxID=208452 RepID=A0A1B1E5Y4_9APIC|nr:Uncharacterized protein PCOAH_00043260 [Plasmodium coatneyi]ANQ10169.1 Uncharacterized protein PCOAH_00043260 [Plasmodium coatneyi]